MQRMIRHSPLGCWHHSKRMLLLKRNRIQESTKFSHFAHSTDAFDLDEVDKLPRLPYTFEPLEITSSRLKYDNQLKVTKSLSNFPKIIIHIEHFIYD